MQKQHIFDISVVDENLNNYFDNLIRLFKTELYFFEKNEKNSFFVYFIFLKSAIKKIIKEKESKKWKKLYFQIKFE